MNRGDVIIEFVSVGNVVKVTAVDAATGIEACIVGDPHASEDRLKQLAIRKLHYVMNKHSGNDS